MVLKEKNRSRDITILIAKTLQSYSNKNHGSDLKHIGTIGKK